MMDRAVAVADAESSAAAIAALIHALALRTAVSMSSPFARPAAIADDNEQPVPWVFFVAMRGAGQRDRAVRPIR